jgi:membrane-bound lytic murein transglycosylase D
VIAEEYDVSVEDLMYWNNIRNERKIQAGKSIDIFIDKDLAADFKSAAKETPAKSQVKKENPVAELQKKSTPAVFSELKNGKKVEHVVKSGESPFVIAQKYPGVNPDDILLWNNISDARKIQIGQTLIIYLKN